MGERIFQQHMPEKIITSAGLHAVIGHPIERNMVIAAQAHGINIANHQARQLTEGMCGEQDLILVMEKRHISMLANVVPQAQGKTLLFGHWHNQQEIKDPYNQHYDEHERAVTQLIKSAEGWIDVLRC